MKRINCIAIDDEPIALSVISQFCLRSGGIDLLVYSEPQEGLQAVIDRQPDVVFLDIEMDCLNGLDIARKLPSSTCFIFTTAYIRYALDGFNLDAVDFLHKPFSYERFEIAVEKARRRMEYIRGAEEIITVKQEYNNVVIPIADILYVEAMENYSKFFRRKGFYVLSRMNLKAVEELLPARRFVRIHRSFIVAVDAVSSFSRQEIRLASGQLLPIGRLYAEKATARLQNPNPDNPAG
ncbi:MAG: LytTR family DNA-binding domain-containing protein [Bacteroides sp.]|nr:LytTR family DNA-binding domain-containing protein [Bacteroides sp.]MCM1085740.1 LytTR family DNA-binding domain-containing protein [Bacteroides sp.]